MKTAKFLSSYVKAADVKRPQIVTITTTEERSFKKDDGTERPALVVFFAELEQAVVLCKESIEQITLLTGADDTDGWAGKRVEMFNDPNVKFGSKRVGGIRFRAPAKAN